MVLLYEWKRMANACFFWLYPVQYCYIHMGTQTTRHHHHRQDHCLVEKWKCYQKIFGRRLRAVELPLSSSHSSWTPFSISKLCKYVNNMSINGISAMEIHGYFSFVWSKWWGCSRAFIVYNDTHQKKNEEVIIMKGMIQM